MAILSAEGRGRHESSVLVYPADRGAWPTAWAVLGRRLRRQGWWIAGFGALCAVIGLGASSMMPASYTAKAQIMIDPRGLQVFSNDLTSGQFDANAAVNFVESQMQVMQSERVLSRAVQDGGLTAPAPDAAGLRRSQEPVVVSSGLLARLRGALAIARPDRSFIIDVGAKAKTPESAARIANAVVQAYIDEDAASRASAAHRLTGDLTARLTELRRRLKESEAKAEQYRSQNGLAGNGDRLLIEQQLAQALTDLGGAEVRLAGAQARAVQVSSLRDSRVLAALASDQDQAVIASLIERDAVAREEIAQLAGKLGANHPAMIAAQGRVSETSALLGGELGRIRQAAQSEAQRAATERDAMAATVASLTAKLGAAREATVDLSALQQEVETNRALLASFETRARETAEFSQIDSTNLRVVSMARPPELRDQFGAMILWGAMGGILGLVLGLAYVTMSVALTLTPLTRAPPMDERGAPVARPAPAKMGAGAPGGIRRQAASAG